MAGVRIPFINDKTATNMEGALIGDNGQIREAVAGEVVSESDVNALLQAAIQAELADIDGGAPDTTFEEEIDGGTP